MKKVINVYVVWPVQRKVWYNFAACLYIEHKLVLQFAAWIVTIELLLQNLD